MLFEFPRALINMKQGSYNCSLMIISYFCLIFCFFEPTQSQFIVEYWEVKPFIWTENKILKGLVVDILQRGDLSCEKTEKGLTFNKHSYTEFQNITKDIALLNRNDTLLRKTLFAPLMWYGTQQRINSRVHFDSLQMNELEGYVVALQRDKISLFAKLANGIWKCTSIIVVMVCCSLLSGTFIWILVSKIWFHFILISDL